VYSTSESEFHKLVKYLELTLSTKVRKMAAVSFSMGKFIAGIVIAILAASVISVGVSMLVPGPQGPEGPQGDTGPQGLQDHRANEALGCHSKATFQFHILHSCHLLLTTVAHIHITTDYVTPMALHYPIALRLFSFRMVPP
jgi:hypothetical protein